jgi:adenylate cyclase
MIFNDTLSYNRSQRKLLTRRYFNNNLTSATETQLTAGSVTVRHVRSLVYSCFHAKSMAEEFFSNHHDNPSTGEVAMEP